MNIKLYFLVTRNYNNPEKILSLYSPDFDLQIPVGDAELINQDLLDLVAFKITPYITRLSQISMTKGLEQCNQPIIPNLQHWEELTIAVSLKRGFFASSLPITGHITNSIAILTSSLSTFMSFKIASDNSNNNHILDLSIPATALYSMVNLIMYTYSDTSLTLGTIGTNIDKFLSNESGDQTKSLKGARKTLSALFMLILITNLLIAATSLYQQTVLLSQNFLDLNKEMSSEEREHKMKLLKWFGVYLMLGTSIFSSLAFQWTFALRCVDDLITKLEKNKPCKPFHFLYNLSARNQANTHEQSLLTERLRGF